MISAIEPSMATTSDWGRAFAQDIQEFSLTPLAVTGRIPAGLRGSLYRNGPTMFERKGERIAHWFDGDGAVLGVHFDGQTAQGAYRRVQTAGFLAEEAADEFLSSGYGRRSASFWNRSPLKNVANTSVLALEDRLLALWEGGFPHVLDLQTLDTKGLDSLQFLEPGQSFSAHPKVDPHTGEIYNFGVSFGRKSVLNLYRCDRQGTLLGQSKIPLQGVPLIHDCILAGPYLVFCIPPVTLDVLPLLMCWKSYSEALCWRPERGTQILVVDRETLQPLAQSEADPWFQWHFGNGFVDVDGSIVIDVARYDDFQTNQFLQEVPSGHPKTAALSTLWRLRIQPQTAVVETAEQLDRRSCEFPSVSPARVGQSSRYTYFNTHSDQDSITNLHDAIGYFDHEQEKLSFRVLGEHLYPSEPIFAPNPDQADQGWILSVVYDAQRHASEVWIYDQTLGEPLCRVSLPSAVAPGFHGTWRPS